MKLSVFIFFLIILNAVSTAQAEVACNQEFKDRFKACTRGTKVECAKATKAYTDCINEVRNPGGGSPTPAPTPGSTGPAGTFSGQFTSVKFKNKASDCETRTAIPATLIVTLKGKKNLKGTFSDSPVALKGQTTKKGYEISGKQSAKGAKTEFKFTASKLSATSVTIKFTKVRSKAAVVQCSATYTATLARQ